MYLTPAGTLATLTVNLPTSPIDGQVAGILTTQTITALTIGAQGGGSVTTSVTSLPANTAVHFMAFGGVWRQWSGIVAGGGGGAVGANPTGTIGLAAVNGSAGTFMRSDAAPPLSQAIAPTWTGTHTFRDMTWLYPTTGTAVLRIRAATDTTQDAGWVQWYRDDGSTERAWIGYGSNGTDVFTINNQVGDIAITPAGGDTNFTGNVAATGVFSGSGASLTSLNAANISSGTLAVARGGTGAGTLTGYVKGNGTSAFTASATIPYSDITGGPTAVAGANPTATIGLAAVNGSAGTFMRSDAAPPLSQAIAPTWTGVHTWTGNQNPIRIADANAFISFYNAANTVRTGFLQLVVGAASTLAIEQNQPLNFFLNGATRFTFSAAGAFTATAGISATTGSFSSTGSFGGQCSAGSFQTTSRRALKRETGRLSGVADILARLRPMLYRLLAGDDREQLGLIAEEVHAVCPQLSDGKTVAYDRLALLLLADWQAQRAAT
jgi:hypothetical protein